MSKIKYIVIRTKDNYPPHTTITTFIAENNIAGMLYTPTNPDQLLIIPKTHVPNEHNAIYAWYATRPLTWVTTEEIERYLSE